MPNFLKIIPGKMELLQRLINKHKMWIGPLSPIIIAFVGYLDTITGLYLEMGIFYLIPIFLSTWYLGSKAGGIMACMATLSWMIADGVGAVPYLSWNLILWNGVAHLVFFLMIVYLLTRIKRQNNQLEDLARTDALTGLNNRRAFYEAVTHEIDACQRYGWVFTLAYMDVDDFKHVNDTFGHNVGDELLRLIGDILRQHTRRVDIVARLGGDEYVILFPQTDAQVARQVVTKLRIVLLENLKKGTF
jgi:diguanylate cyclase (GGDEF)-like protein